MTAPDKPTPAVKPPKFCARCTKEFRLYNREKKRVSRAKAKVAVAG